MELKVESKVKNLIDKSLTITLKPHPKEFGDLKLDFEEIKELDYLNFYFLENQFYYFRLHDLLIKDDNQEILKLNFFFQKNSKTTFYLLFNENNNHFLNLYLEEGAIVELFLINIYDYNLNISINGVLNGLNSNLKLYSLSVLQTASKNQYINVIHNSPKSKTNVISYDLCLGKADIVNRIINIVPEQIKNCSSHQSIKCLNFNNLAKIDNNPILAIYNNDVDCSHGCAVGDINVNEFVYFFSRGFSKQQVQEMVTLGYSIEILKNLYDIKVETEILNYLRKRIHHFFHG